MSDNKIIYEENEIDVDTDIKGELEEGSEYIGEIKAGKPRSNKPVEGEVEGIPYEHNYAFSTKFWKQVGAVKVEEGKYIRVMKRKALPIVGIILILFAAFCIIAYLLTGQNVVQNTFNYVGDKTGITEPNKDAKGIVAGYTSFESVPEDITWAADTTTQTITLKNAEGNKVDLVPKIYVDFNGDGSFTDDECLYNQDGSTRIAPGNEIDTVELTKPLSAGTYFASVVYSAFVQETNNSANGMNFNFTLTVQ